MINAASILAPVRPAASAFKAVPPADRPKGKRGFRGWLAAVLALGAPAIMFVAQFQGGSGGGSTDGSRTYDYTISGPPGLGLKAALVAFVFAAAAVLVWTARNPRGLLAAALLTGSALAGTALVTTWFDSAEVADRELRALKPGLSRSEVEDRLGTPAGTGSYSDARRNLDCLVWNRAEVPAGSYDTHAIVCFAGDRFELKSIL